MIKRYLGLLLVIVLFISLTSCSGGKTKGKTDQYGNDEDDIIGITIKGETLEVVITYPREKAIVFEEVVADFEDITGAIAEITAYHNDYENKLQARMAANSLPDIFHAHGWSILDYREYFKEYFADLQNESWVGLYTDSALEVTRDDDGSVYVLMISQQANATLVNLDVCAKAGVDPYLIYDWDDFTDACQRIMDAGFTPIAAAAGNPGTLTNIAGSWLNYKGVPVDET
ncbi:MAG TPA: extracellular solute-binding protein, partial [Clostridia bacterium]|nr:extracellular solute-binding protein [Clostridia bacterium]